MTVMGKDVFGPLTVDLVNRGPWTVEEEKKMLEEKCPKIHPKYHLTHKISCSLVFFI